MGCYKYLGYTAQSTPLRASISFIFLSSQRFRLSSSFIFFFFSRLWLNLLWARGRGEKVFHRSESTGTLVSLIQGEFIEARLIEAFCYVRPSSSDWRSTTSEKRWHSRDGWHVKLGNEISRIRRGSGSTERQTHTAAACSCVWRFMIWLLDNLPPGCAMTWIANEPPPPSSQMASRRQVFTSGPLIRNFVSMCCFPASLPLNIQKVYTAHTR